MVVRTGVIVRVANISATYWQEIACLNERVSSTELLDLICCLPLHHLGRLAFCLWTFFCFPPTPDSYYFYHDSDTASSDSLSSYYVDDPGYGSHSD